MTTPASKGDMRLSKRYIADLQRLDTTLSQTTNLRGLFLPISLSFLFLVIVACFLGFGYMANNMGPAVGGKVLTVFRAVIIAPLCESAGALIATSLGLPVSSTDIAVARVITMPASTRPAATIYWLLRLL